MARTLWDYARQTLPDSITETAGLRPLYAELKKPRNRLRKPGGERRMDGTLCANQNRMGPLTMDARREGLRRVLEIQAEVNAAAERLNRPLADHIDPVEARRINELIDLGTWPDGWDGSEPRATELLPIVYADGSVQHLLFGD